ncbi:MAG: gamma-glutamyl-gamma-aminobutyrate hydrolase family protein [Bacteroidetes bacterium]|nr:gamma-glutamyl-gamma-aminobutyrate hydrolase family protein [Bacteroidota bacterium]
MKIAVTDCGNPKKQPLYLGWLQQYQPEAELVTVGHSGSVTSLEGFDGLVLTGGEDVDPLLSKAEPVEKVEAIDRKRDDLEFALLASSQQLRLPVLGICRGLQVANVFFGGTLIADLPTAGYEAHTALRGAPELRHRIAVNEGTLLQTCTGVPIGDVNSYHHQAVREPAPVLEVSAYSDDMVAEAMEWKQNDGRPFLLLVQWHPERMTDRENPFAARIAEAFFTAVRTNDVTA